MAVLMSPARFINRRKTRLSSVKGARLVMVSLERNRPLMPPRGAYPPGRSSTW